MVRRAGCSFSGDLAALLCAITSLAVGVVGEDELRTRPHVANIRRKYKKEKRKFFGGKEIQDIVVYFLLLKIIIKKTIKDSIFIF